ncbi:MAG: HAMP domain-containing histidine kinase [Clostridia bacterium]|nr:HAMP domain-containing histidine kinase [Clostridia bacterium]
MKNSFLVKCIAIILFAVTMTTLVLSGVCIVFGYESNAFLATKQELEENKDSFLETFLWRYEYRICNSYEDSLRYNTEYGGTDGLKFPSFSDNILFEIKDKNGKVVYSDIGDSSTGIEVTFGNVFYVLKEEYRNKNDNIEKEQTTLSNESYEEETSAPIEIEKPKNLSMTLGGAYESIPTQDVLRYYDDKSYEVTLVYMENPIVKDHIYYLGIFYDWIVEKETKFYIAAAVSSILAFVLFIIILRIAGHNGKSDNVMISKFDKFPVDILIAVYGGLTFLLFGGCLTLYGSMADWWQSGYGEVLYEFVPFLIGVCIFAILLDFSLLAILLTTISVRCKTSTFIKSTFIYKLLAIIWKILKHVWKGFVNFNKHNWKLIRKIPMVWKTVVVAVVIIAIEFLILLYDYGEMWPVAILLNCILCVGVILVSILLKDIKNTTEEIANGNVYNKIDTKHLFLDLKDHAENINNISDGIQKAVAEQMKSERFKTELITNVSHDIKTPLTSIINYVDLLEKEEIDNQTAKEYIDVLSRQSSRLKKLIDDLMEASKVSTGNISVNLMKFELAILLSQALGEYEERFEKNNLQVVLNKTDEMLFVMADNRHMWRVFDNVLNNIAKYAQSGTRVYVDAKRNGQFAEISFRNISKDPLNISGDELMERFVRGDSSRNTEGSGLGLSIAKSLTEVQKGNLAIQIDGDLFKVLLKFPLSE